MRCFSSPAYPHPDYVFIRGSQGSPPCGVPPFGDPRLPARARLPEAFRCYATSFFGTNGLGIHPTPSLTVCTSTRDRRVAPVAAGPCHTAHINHPLIYLLSLHPAHATPARAGHCFALVLTPRFLRCSRSRPRLLPDNRQAANDDSDRKRNGGDEETRTPDPLRAKEVLSQLSYIPKKEIGGRLWIRTTDLTLIRGVL
jgi:hypothetical protein